MFKQIKCNMSMENYFLSFSAFKYFCWIDNFKSETTVVKALRGIGNFDLLGKSDSSLQLFSFLSRNSGHPWGL